MLSMRPYKTAKFFLVSILLVASAMSVSAYASGLKVNYGKTMCEDAIEGYLLQQYPLQASKRQEVMTEYRRLIATYLAPTDWKTPVGINDLSNKLVAQDRRFFLDNIFSFGESTTVGPIAKEAFLRLPDPKFHNITFENNHSTFFSFVHFIDFNNYQYFFCKNHRIYASLRKAIFAEQNLDLDILELKKSGHRLISNSTDESGLTTVLVEKSGNYNFLKIRGKELYQFSFDPSFAIQRDARLTGEMLK